MRRFRLIVVVVVVVFAAGVFGVYQAGRQESTAIRARYQQLSTALASGDTNGVLALIAPQSRREFDSGRFMRMDSFAAPLGASSKILVLGKQATVWPSPNWYLCRVWPIGNTIEMTRVGGSWFFTGRVHLD